MSLKIEPIATIYNDYSDKFGIPRQSGLLNNNISKIIFEPKFRDVNSLRGLEGYSHIWLLWLFDKNNSNKEWSPTVRPPRLGGNKRLGVFSTRSPYHPNGIGLSCVKIESIEKTQDVGSVIKVSGADLMSGTQIIDIKPYLTYTDSHPDALCGFAEKVYDYNLNVKLDFDECDVPSDILAQIIDILKQDPRPSYHDNPERIYGMSYAGYEIKFKVDSTQLHVISINKTLNGSEQ